MGQPVTAKGVRARHLAGESGLGSMWDAEDPFDAPKNASRLNATTALMIVQDREFDIFIGAVL